MSAQSNRRDDLVKRLEEEILPVFENVIAGEDTFFHNPHLADCRKVRNCTDADCVVKSNGGGPLRCWHVPGTVCDGTPQSSFLQKYGKCRECRVFRDSCPTIVEEIGERINTMVVLMKEQKEKMLDDKHRFDHLNEQLTSLREQLDLKSREIQKMMITDSLTKLYNRHHLVTVLEDEMARCQRYGHSLAMMMIDIDEFRSFNEDYGQQAGDNMLEVCGMSIKENIRKFDRAFRYGGEEFVIVLPETDITLAYIVAERIRRNFQNKTFRVTNQDGKVREKASRTISIGITATFAYQTNIISIEELINQAERALFISKEKGGNASVRHGE
jgi:diguanylate cyclase (GGDEF)-like protein